MLFLKDKEDSDKYESLFSTHKKAKSFFIRNSAGISVNSVQLNLLQFTAAGMHTSLQDR